jgi:hypothetical protein
MLERIVPIRGVAFVLLAACEALCQRESPSVDLLQRGASNSPEVRQEIRMWRLLPHVPSARVPTPAEDFLRFVNQGRSPLTMGADGSNERTIRETELNTITARPKPSFYPPSQAGSSPGKSAAFLEKCLYPSRFNQNLRYDPSMSDSLIGRVTYAGSRIFVTRDEFGKSRLNTAYIVRALTSIAAATASRPSWRRSPGAPFGDFGSTVGNEAGMNLWREFRPGIEKLMKGHTPRFVSKLKEHIDHK